MSELPKSGTVHHRSFDYMPYWIIVTQFSDGASPSTCYISAHINLGTYDRGSSDLMTLNTASSLLMYAQNNSMACSIFHSCFYKLYHALISAYNFLCCRAPPDPQDGATRRPSPSHTDMTSVRTEWLLDTGRREERPSRREGRGRMNIVIGHELNERFPCLFESP